MSIRRRLSPEARRTEILLAVIELAGECDLASVPTARVAERAGVSQGLLFRYFPTRAALQLAVVQQAADELIAAVKSASGGGALERVLAGLQTYLDHVERSASSWAVLLRPAPDPDVAAVLAGVERASVDLLCGALEVDELPPALGLAVSAWLAFERRACQLWLASRDTTSPVSREVLTDMLLGSLLGATDALQARDPALRRLLQPLMPDQRSTN